MPVSIAEHQSTKSGISRRRATSANFGCERCGLLIAADSIYVLLSPSVAASGQAERFHDGCYSRRAASMEAAEQATIENSL